MKTRILMFVSVMIMMLTTNVFAQVGDATTINGPTSVCANSSVVYSTPAISNATSYMWVVPSGATIVNGYGSNSIDVQFGSVSGDVIVFGQNGGNVGNGVSLNVSVNAAPTVAITVADQDICAGESTTLTATGGNFFLWSTGATTSTITTSPTMTTSYTVTVTGSNGCTTSAHSSVVVHALPNVSLSLVEKEICNDVHHVILAGGLPAGGVYSCSTPFIVFDGNTIYPGVTGPGTWNITYTVTNAYGCVGSAQDLFTVNNRPVVMFDNIPGSLTTNSVPVDLNNFVMPQGGVFTGAGIDPGSSILDFGKAGAGTHMLTYKYTDPITGCSFPQIQYVTITQESGDGPASVHTHAVENISFPNPVGNNIRFNNINTQSIKRIEIFTMLGTMEYTTNVTSSSMDIDISGLKVGTYLVRFVDVDGFSITKRIMKYE